MKEFEIFAVGLIALGMVLLSALVWRGCLSEEYQACVNKASEVSACNGVKP